MIKRPSEPSKKKCALNSLLKRKQKMYLMVFPKIKKKPSKTQNHMLFLPELNHPRRKRKSTLRGTLVLVPEVSVHSTQ